MGILLTLATFGAVAHDWPSVPVPDDATGEWVTKDMLYNGLHMRTSRFEVAQTPAEVEAFYRKEWGAQIVKTPLRNKTVLGHAEGKHYMTIELAGSGGGTRAQVGVMEIPAHRPPPPGANFPRPPDTRVYEDIVYLDTPTPARTLNMKNGLSPQQNAGFYARTLRSQGYAAQHGTMACGATTARCIAFYAKGDQKMMISFSRVDGGSSIVAVQSQ